MNVGGKDNIKRQVYDNLKCNFEGKEGNLSNKLHCCSSKLSQGMILKDMDTTHKITRGSGWVPGWLM